MDCSVPGFLIHHQLLELSQIHVHRVGDVLILSEASLTSIEISQITFLWRSVLLIKIQQRDLGVYFFMEDTSAMAQCVASVSNSAVITWKPLPLPGERLSFSHLPGENTGVPIPFSGFISPRCSSTRVTFLLIVLLKGKKMICFPVPSLKMWKLNPRDNDLFLKTRLQLPLVKCLGAAASLLPLSWASTLSPWSLPGPDPSCL